MLPRIVERFELQKCIRITKVVEEWMAASEYANVYFSTNQCFK